MPETFDVWKLLAGLGIFMFGMFLMEESVKNLAGRSFKTFIRNYTTGRIKSVLSGAFVTAILQSSSAVSLMVLAFVGAGIMAMENAIGVILGSNIGTTATAWLVAFFGFKVNIEDYSLPLIGIGGLGLIFLGRSVRYSNISKLLVGFGFLFMGLDYMKTSVEQLTQTFDITSLPDYGILPYALAGLVLTAVMQSSSATIAIVLTALNAKVIAFNAAAAMVVGANVGTTVTVILGTIGASQIKKRVALSHFSFNFISAVIGLLLLPAMVWLISLLLGPKNNDAVMGIALYHTLFNVLGVLFFMPFIGLFSKLLIKVFPDKVAISTKYIQNVTAEVSDAAIEGLHKEVLYFISNALKYNLHALRIDSSLVFEDENVHVSKRIKHSQEDDYDGLKLLQSEIFSFASTILMAELSKDESKLVNSQLHAARMALHSTKSIKDVIHNFDEFESSDNAVLNEENALFRKRMIELYLKLVSVMEATDHSDIGGKLGKILKHLKKEDEKFVSVITTATAQGKIKNLDITNMLMVNRAFVQSSRQVVLALKEILLSESELALFESMTENDVDEAGDLD
ncbi:MAG: Na/Pi symporter [Flavobacteriales bacterium]|nr:Na/Pi symporter [Flavobacteriales bacterium]